MFNLYKIAQELNKKNFMYHQTTQDNAQKILKEGLKINSNKNYTYNDQIRSIYKIPPIFLSYKKNPDYTTNNSVCFKVDVSNLPLITDFGSLTDYGAYLEEDHFWFERTPKKLKNSGIDYDGAFYYKDFLKPGLESNLAIELTKSAACPVDISLDRIFLCE